MCQVWGIRAIARLAMRHRAKQRLIAQSNGLTLARSATISTSTFEQRNHIAADCTVINSSLGKYTYAGPRTSIVNATVGRYTSIASDVVIGAGAHPTDEASMHPAFYLHEPAMGWDYVPHSRREEFARTTVGSDVWIGNKVTLIDGVTIGDGAVIGAGAVVTKDVEPYGVYVGVPAKLKRYRFDAATIARFLAFRWWDKDEQWIRDHAGDLMEAVCSSG